MGRLPGHRLGNTKAAEEGVNTTDQIGSIWGVVLQRKRKVKGLGRGTAPTQLRGSNGGGGGQQDQGRRSTSPSFKGTRRVTRLRIVMMESDCS